MIIRPVAMTTEELLEVLDEIRSHVNEGSSYEGSLRYVLNDDEVPDYMVTAVYRTSVSGARVIGHLR